jgi:hypothetical protein
MLKESAAPAAPSSNKRSKRDINVIRESKPEAKKAAKKIEEEEIALLQSTKDLPIKEIEREAYHKRKEKFGTHHVKFEEGHAPGGQAHFVGKDIVEKVLHEKKEEREKLRHMEDLAA